MVSIVTTTRNRSHYLKEAVESVLAQEYGNWELIIADDGSTDSTKDLIQSYTQRDARIRGIYKPHTGISDSRNQALLKSSGKYLAFLDDDDVWLSEKLKKQLDYLEMHPQTGLLFSQVYITDENLVRQSVYPINCQCSLVELLKWNFWIPFSSVVVRRNCLDSVGLFDKSLDRSQDYDLWLRIAKKFNFDCLRDEPLLFYRQHTGNVSQECTGRHLAHIWTYQKLRRSGDLKIHDRLLKNRIGWEYYELGRFYLRNKGNYRQAARYFFTSLLASPAVGLQYQKYCSHSILFSILKPFLATGYCLLRGLLPYRQKGDS